MCLTAGQQNAWQIVNMPLLPSLVNGWFAACKNDLFCVGPSGSYFDLPSDTCVAPTVPGTNTSTCRFFRDVYANSSDFIQRLWASNGLPSFVMGPNLTNSSYNFFPKGVAAFPAANPNDAVDVATTEPPFCTFRPAVNGWDQAVSDIQLYASNMLKYAGAAFNGTLFTSAFGANATLNASWYTYAAVAAPPPPPACASSGSRPLSSPLAAVLVGVGAALVAVILI